MSAFLPEQSQTSPSGVTEFTPASPQTTTDDVALMQRVFQAAAQNPLMLPADFMAYILDFIQTSVLNIPIGQVFGYQNSVTSIVAEALAKQAVLTAKGTVGSTGTITSGNGFSVNHISTGRYVITFATAFSALPAVVASAIANTGNEDLTINTPGLSSVQININDGGGPADRGFSFIAFQAS